MNDNTGSDSPDRNVVNGQEPLPAKLCMPRLANGIARSRIFGILDRARQKSGIWIAAPAGAGKTTVVATYIGERQIPNIWYQMDKYDADPATLFYYLGVAAKSLCQTGEVNLPLLTPEYLPDIQGFARRFFRDLFAVLPHGSIIVLDNYQELEDAGIITEILRDAIAEVPAAYNLLIISRTNPAPEFARHRVCGGLEIIPWDVIRLSAEETAIIAESAGESDNALINSLHERCEGWVAGLILLLEYANTRRLGDQAIDLAALETIFDFFTSELFERLPAGTRDFLLKTSQLPYMTPALAELVSGSPEGGGILVDFYRRHLFTDRRGLNEITYHYHALFREFLLSKLEQAYTPSERMELARHAARQLASQGWYTEAVNMYLGAQDWETASPIIQEQAPRLLAQGRAQIIVAWLQRVPDEYIASDPWLLYWHGVSLQLTDPFKARARLEQAYATFASDKSVIGQLLAAAAIINMTYYQRLDLNSAVPWVEVLKGHLDSNPAFMSPAMEARILSGLIAMLEYMRTEDPRLPHYVERLESLLGGGVDACMDDNEKLEAAGRLIIYYSIIKGDAQACDRILLFARALQESDALAVPTRFAWKILSVLPYMFTDGAGDLARECADALIAMVKGKNLTDMLEENNLSVLEFIIAYHAVLLYLHLGDTAAAKPLLVRMEALVKTPRSIDMGLLAMTKCLYAFVEGDFSAAHQLGQTAMQIQADVCAGLTRPDMSCIAAIVCCERGKPEETMDYLALPKSQGFHNSPRMHYQVLMIEAYANLLQGDLENCHARMREAFVVARDNRHWGNVFWLMRIMPRLCAEALRAGIETDHVRELIVRRGLLPPDSAGENWPWPVRIYTMGRFELVIDDQPFDMQTKAQKKPLGFLEVLVGLGGTGVKRENISDVLWPDAEADAALIAFTTTLSRLRKLIGDKAILMKGGRVSLNERLCWVDVRALETKFDVIDEAGTDCYGDCDSLQRIMELYRGPFLSDEEGVWAHRIRNRLRSKYTRFIANSFQSLKTSGGEEKGVGALYRLLEADPDCEPLLRSLIADYPFEV